METVLGVWGPGVWEVVGVTIPLVFFVGVIVAIFKVLKISKDTTEIRKMLNEIKEAIQRTAR